MSKSNVYEPWASAFHSTIVTFPWIPIEMKENERKPANKPTSFSRKTLELVRDIRGWQRSWSSQPNLSKKKHFSLSKRQQLMAEYRSSSGHLPLNKTHERGDVEESALQKKSPVSQCHDQSMYTKPCARTHWIDYSFLYQLCKTCTFHTALSPGSMWLHGGWIFQILKQKRIVYELSYPIFPDGTTFPKVCQRY